MGHRHDPLKGRLPPVFMDTAGWVAAARRDAVSEAWLAQVEAHRDWFGRLHTSDYVLMEAYSFIARNHRREKAEAFLEEATGPEVYLHPSDADLVDRAMDAARRQRLKRDLSLVDWTTALLMRDHGVGHIVTSDHAFAQLGFTVLP